MTRDEALAAIAQRRALKIISEVTWEQFAQTISALPLADKNVLVDLVRRRRACDLGGALLAHVQARVETLAAAEAQTILADDMISLAELDKIF